MNRSTGCALLLLAVALALAAWPDAVGEENPPARAATQDVSIATPRGVTLEGVLHLPAQPTGVIVVIGAGRGYHMGLPFLVRTAEHLQQVGVAALRFDWAYHTAKGQHSPDLAVELEDLEAALAFARGVEGVRHVVLAGKSLGSVAAVMRASAHADDLAGLMLLTWPIHPPGNAAEPFPAGQEFARSWQKPWLIACGDADPFSDLGALYALAANCAHPPRLVIAPGDHGFNGPRGREDEAGMQANVDLAARGIARWARVWAEAWAAAK